MSRITEMIADAMLQKEKMTPTGAKTPWNNRDILRNEYGGLSTERAAIRHGPFGSVVRFPTIWKGKLLNEDAAYRRALATGEFQVFKSIDEAMNDPRSSSMGLMMRNSGLEE